MKKQATPQDEARAELRKMLKPGDTVYTVLRHVSASGMSRRISMYAIGKDRKPFSLDWYAERLDVAKRHPKHEGLNVGGAGMDMGYHLVHRLGNAIWPKGTRKPHSTRNGEPDTYGGYALQHRWL